jgi:hypothetical protein
MINNTTSMTYDWLCQLGGTSASLRRIIDRLKN